MHQLDTNHCVQRTKSTKHEFQKMVLLKIVLEFLTCAERLGLTQRTPATDSTNPCDWLNEPLRLTQRTPGTDSTNPWGSIEPRLRTCSWWVFFYLLLNVRSRSPFKGLLSRIYRSSILWILIINEHYINFRQLTAVLYYEKRFNGNTVVRIVYQPSPVGNFLFWILERFRD